MKKNKKGEGFGITGTIISVFVVIVILVVIFIPTYTSSVSDADSSILECNDVVLDTLNITAGLCFNGTNMSLTEAPSEEGLTTTQEAVLLIVPTFMVLGGLFLAGKKFGIIGNN